MRNSQNIYLSRSETVAASEETTWSFPGALVGFVSWLLALGIPFLLYGPNTLFFLLYTWPFFLALMPVAVVVGIAVHSLLDGKLALQQRGDGHYRGDHVWRVIYVADGLTPAILQSVTLVKAMCQECTPVRPPVNSATFGRDDAVSA